MADVRATLCYANSLAPQANGRKRKPTTQSEFTGFGGPASGILPEPGILPGDRPTAVLYPIIARLQYLVSLLTPTSLIRTFEYYECIINSRNRFLQLVQQDGRRMTNIIFLGLARTRALQYYLARKQTLPLCVYAYEQIFVSHVVFFVFSFLFPSFFF
ncbi:hypothetical protein M433DRAFT_391718 [Acidomyces richmondensis BFW]|nr:MAG: hypothetical protein FE78DRAFT_225997 [Acidomyces sp. 'richmondensis']KYG48731.1 hypothetical protein M433DRAFT_391718 [Acidomyces richmondensis BFW]